MKKFFIIILNILTIVGIFYVVSPEFTANSIKTRIDNVYLEVLKQNKEVVTGEIYNSGDIDLVNMDALIAGNIDVIDPYEYGIDNKDDFISILKFKIISIILPISDGLALTDYNIFDKIKNINTLLELRYIFIILLSFSALLCIFFSASAFGIIGGIGSAIMYSLFWCVAAFYLRGDITSGGSVYLTNLFKQYSILEVIPGMDKLFNMNRTLFFKNILYSIIFFFVYGIGMGSAFSSRNKKYEEKLIKLETENKKNLAQLKRLQFAEDEFKKAGDKIAKLSSRVISLQMLSQVLGASLNLESALDEVINTAAKLFGSKKCAIFLIDKKSNLYVKKQKGYVITELKGIKINTKQDTEHLFSYVMKSKSLVTTDVAKKDFNIGEMMKKMTVDTVMVSPLVHGEDVLGILLIGDVENEKNIQDDGRLLTLLATLTSLAIKNAHLHEKTVELANKDGLTGMYNNRYFNEFLDDLMKRSLTTGEKISIFMTDIDHFKSFNDTYGHQVGDFVLEQTAKLMIAHERENDIAARYGGEEFVLIMPDTGTDEAMQIAEKLRQIIEGRKYKYKNEDLSVTVSIGVSTFPDHAKVKKTLVKYADDGLYLAKEGGRNQVRCAPAEKGISAGGSDSIDVDSENVPDAAAAPADTASNEGTEDIFKF